MNSSNRKLFGAIALTFALSLASCQPPSTPDTPEDIPEPQVSPNPASNGLSTMPDGNYFYGETDNPQAPGQQYLIFEKSGSQIVGQFYRFGTDSSSCFQGKAGNDRIDDVTNAYFNSELMGNLEEGQNPWIVEKGEPIALDPFVEIGISEAPDFAVQQIDECRKILQENQIGQSS